MQVDPEYDIHGNRKYMIKMVHIWIKQQQIADLYEERLEILMEDLEAYFRKDDEKQMLVAMRNNTMRYIEIFTDIVSQLMPEPIKKEGSDKNVQI